MLLQSIQDEVIAFAQEIVRIDSPSGQEKDVAAAIEKKMHSLAYDRVDVDAYGNVIASRRGTQPGATILFDGHMDVVPATNLDAWSVPPFSGEIHTGKIWGRGASDEKGPLAAAVVALGRIPAEEFAGTLVVSASVGEERHEGAALEKVMDAVRPDFVVICEPNGCRLGIGQKGRAGIWVDVTGKPAHSAVPHLGDNAVYKATEIIERLRRMSMLKDEILGDGIMELIDGISRPYPSQSTIPVGFYMHYDRRLVRGESPESILQSVREALGGLSDWEIGYQQVRIETYTGQVLDLPDIHPGWVTDRSSTWIQKAQAGLEWAGIQPVYTTALFCTNGSYSAGFAGVPTLIFGPSSGMLAHCIDEHIEIAELLQGVQGYWGLARELGRVE